MAIFRKSALERLSSPEELDQLIHVTSPRAWLALAALFGLLLAALLWSIFAVIPTTASAQGVLVQESVGGKLQALAYMSLADSPNIRPGMAAKISLPGINQADYGLLLGTVSTVDQLPSDQPAMAQAVGNGALAQSLAASGHIVRVVVDLLPDANTAGGYLWSRQNNSAPQLQQGMLSNATITIREQRPINLLIP